MDKVLRFAQHRAPGAPRAIDLLADGATIPEAAAQSGLPEARVRGIAGFYDQLHPTVSFCTGTACTFARGHTPKGNEIRCIGACYAAPTTTDRRPPPIPRRSLVANPVVLRYVLGQPRPDPGELPEPDVIFARVGGLRGRGGAAFPTATKWKSARDTAAPRRFIVANGDEGDPGSYVDRLLLEEDAKGVLVGMALCARAINATEGLVYIRAEYPEAQARMERAITEATWLPIPVRVVRGAGSYVCGEETALLRSIEGLRGEPWPKPPYPAQEGLWGMPTVVQNVETLVVVADHVLGGGGVMTKAFSISGAVREPGIVEAPLGIPLRELLGRGAGGGDQWKMAVVGGPMGRIVPESEFDVPLGYDTLPGLGHGGIVVLDERVSPAAVARHLYKFAREESCGNCTPCRVGCAQLASMRDRESLLRLLKTMEMGSLCGFGQGVSRPLHDLLRVWGDEVFAC